MIQDNPFCNALVDEAITLYDQALWRSTAGNIDHLWETLPHNSKMTRLHVDMWIYVHAVQKIPFRQWQKHIPQGFVSEIAIVCMEERSMMEHRPSSRPRCFYHVHESDADKCK